jgi:lipopolysaccharide/colanic/teichoic acid biosynthesis glycosyltransferase
MVQRIRDFFLLVVLSPFLLPLFILVWVLCLIFHKNEIFFAQRRVGKNGKEFILFKFRSMILNAQEQGSGLFSYEDDYRITSFGRILRRTSLDELPQLLHVLKGEMSFVGPRPAVVGELEAESDMPIEMLNRFNVKPGLTGWAQIHGRDNLSWRQKITYDLEYVSFSPWKRFYVDILIIIYTPFYLLKFNDTYEKRY